MKVSLILASYDSGHYHGGMGQGPDALISGGLVDALTLAGHDVTVEDIGRVGDDQEREIATGFAVCNAVSGEVRIARDRGRFPIVLAGNCLTSAGAVAGEGADAIIWADQHGDLNTPETSVYGFLDGMALSTVLGLCWRPMAAAIPGFKPIDPSRCVLVNARDLDPAEEKLLETLPVIRTECPGVGQATERLKAAGANSVHMHLDLDVHDPQALQANRYVTSGGPNPEQLRDAACAMALAVPIVGITVSAYDPAFDAQADVPPLVGQLLNDLLATIEGR
ncbi:MULTISPECIES: arginase family protein [unclassified Mesorhizobium]|uniref:arginase family protein n=1 Tax=unclassified Mesorhizobium TaxID=325217 RepID=UPI001CC957C3|nr:MULTISPECIES: arginase family protein [unclassified Mesorhizobium]MBZ9738156.1 arginase family protein [Mesorhizobium sp. CO1-1-4]MBZ9803536.1 arginase family protein [Mesorhizobium sp. ES1-6]MBZ9996973.1 arginase family protein [Mesorhizobium sp. BH1-1-4]